MEASWDCPDEVKDSVLMLGNEQTEKVSSKVDSNFEVFVLQCMLI